MTSQQRPISRAELARRKGVSRGAVTRAARGPLAPACLSGSRIDCAHPAVRAWLGEVDPSRVISLAELAALAGVPVEEVERDRHLLEDAIPVQLDHPATQAYLAAHNPRGSNV